MAGQRSAFGTFVYWGSVLAVWGLIFVVGFFLVFAWGLPDTSKLYDVQRQPSISYLDRSGAMIAVRGTQFAPPVDVTKLPAYVPAAFVAVEDRRFYHHPGFDPIGISRAAFRNLRCRCVAGGGSTITQQLAKNLFLTPKQDLRRKAQELVLALWLEWKFSKNEILGLYMNRVYFGSGAYGIEAAAKRYFDKSANELTIGETALLVGSLKAPNRYNPVNEQERAAKRATVVLNEMVQSRVITPEQRLAAVAEKVKVSKNLANQHAQYFVDWLDQEVRGLVGEPTEDMVVETTLDLGLQSLAERAVQTVLDRDRSKGVEQAALVALDGDGRVRAMIGGSDYGVTQFNRAVDARRQAGSSFKPFVYLTATERGYTPNTQVVDEPITIDGWSPKNYTNEYLGPITLTTAVAQSINTVAAKVADEVGRDNVARTARRLGITSKINTDPAMALGAVEVSPLEMAQAYAPLSNGGNLATAYGVQRIRTKSGRILYQHRSAEDGRRASVIGNPALYYTNQMLRTVMTQGTGRSAAIGGYDLAGKTGTTSDYKDAWFVGYTGGFVTAVWVGKDDNRPMRRVTGGSSPAAIWRSFMGAALPRLKVGPIPTGPVPEGGFPQDPIADLLGGLGLGGGTAEGNPDATSADPNAKPTSPGDVPQKKEPELFY